MNRVVRGSDGREWTIKANLEWSNPIAAEEFEHDVNGGAGPGVVMGGVLLFLVVLFVIWTPDEVYVPSWLILLLIVAVLFFPVRWVLHRPWTVTAATPGDHEENPPETWVGVVRGFYDVRKEVSEVARHIELYAEPDMNGSLQPVE
ncbi:hypothetical protein SAMN05421805_103230 [Saccharopolyspora antimicrobica]|uniref:DUF983 domain-containing protein n=2 Tax=Saccharopolyspora TaxID=1835 RepID=A0A1I4X4L3_9PSEU|nr:MULTISPECIES: DUF983 domain-containing protein [Saccharopolyspora]RKT84304.1 hypothetical protein ATL45_2614 [Saccharopolyspora antimicrobica]SEG84342.1 hypothetical protein SAMN02982929_04413 [Saccharopolyspora kobensis]SFD28602.1 hypothetical protein SAMN05216506_103378 [Saccharopolyspora kobensis]SFN20592.1 hypothetical protein SAMN05421805_103230 [Saccharopolyspora antimicrobica]